MPKYSLWDRRRIAKENQYFMHQDQEALKKLQLNLSAAGQESLASDLDLISSLAGRLTVERSRCKVETALDKIQSRDNAEKRDSYFQ